VTIRIVVESPEGYVPSRPDYSKPACCAFNRNIRLKRPADLYLEYRDLAAETSDLENALDRYAMAETFATTANQGLEIARQVALLHAQNRDFETQQEVLRRFYDEPMALDLSATKRQVYWGERLDGFLHWVNYLGLRLPERDFGVLLLESTNEVQLAAWRSLVEQFSRAYPNAELAESTTSEGITRQLQEIRSLVRREPRPELEP
jgi:hypothetical protein